MTDFPIVREGWPYIGVMAIVTVLAAILGDVYWAFIPTVLMCFFLFFFRPKLQLQVEHFGKMATTSGSIKAVEKCIKKFFRGLIAKPLTRTTIQFIGKMQHLVRTIVFNRNALRDILA